MKKILYKIWSGIVIVLEAMLLVPNCTYVDNSFINFIHMVLTLPAMKLLR